MLEDARGRGLVGPGALLPHLAHAWGFGPAVGTCLDLGSGAGLPGLPLALAWPDSRWTLLDAGARRVNFLSQAVRALGLEDRVSVVEGRAEELARRDGLRGRFNLVVARGFGPPAVTAECAAGFLVVGGRLVVSEPPGGRPDRWPPAGLARLGLEPVDAGGEGEAVGGSAYQVLRQASPCPERFPRRVGIPAKRPLFVVR